MINPPRKKVSLWSQVAITFFIVSGGPYGLESAVGAVGAGWTLILTLLIPLLWALPTTLMVSELSSMMPEKGGYYVWVREGLGKFWGFQEGWWTMCYSVVDLSIYPVLFVTYLSFFWPHLNDTQDASMRELRWGICIVFVLAGMLMNLKGSHWIGMHKLAEIIFIALPFVALVVLGLSHGDWQNISAAIHEVFDPSHSVTPAQIAAGLAILIWNFTGWDNATTFAHEVENPHRTIPKSMLICLPLVILFYLLPLLFGYKATIDPKTWGESSGWPEIASHLVGPALGTITAIAAIVSAWALFNSQLLYIARLPSAMAKDSLLPKIFTKESEKHSVPTVSLLVAGAVAAVFSGFTLGKLIIVDILLYSLGLSLEFVTLVALRFRKPELKRPYRIPLGNMGILVLSFLPITSALIVAVSSVLGDSGSYLQLGIAAAAAISGPIVYQFFKHPKA